MWSMALSDQNIQLTAVRCVKQVAIWHSGWQCWSQCCTMKLSVIVCQQRLSLLKQFIRYYPSCRSKFNGGSKNVKQISKSRYIDFSIFATNVFTVDLLLIYNLYGMFVQFVTSPLRFNSLAPGRPGCHFKNTIFNLVLLIGFFISSLNDNAPRRMPWDITDDKSTLVQVMPRCR